MTAAQRPAGPRPQMHWARWGDPARARPLADEARTLVETFLGTRDVETVAPDAVRLGDPLDPALVEQLRGLVGAAHVHTDHDTRLRHTRGKSTPDLLRLRAGDGSDSPDAVVRPGDHEQVLAVVRWCAEHAVALVPFGGGTSVVGGLVARREGYAGVLSLDLGRLDRLVSVDPDSMTAVLQAGLRGPEAEALLATHGLTLGHYPQSFEYATLGGFAVTRSSGQASAGYGRFDDLVVGLTVATPRGSWELGTAPADAAGPDLRRLVLGSEGAFGVVTSLRLRVRRAPGASSYHAWHFPTFTEGAAAMRSLAQAQLLPTVLRLSDETETAVNLAHPDEIGGEETAGGCLLVVGHEGEPEAVAARRTACAAVLSALGGTDLGSEGGEAWARSRFDGPYLRDSLLDAGVLVETLETVSFWSRLGEVYAAVRQALTDALGEGCLVLCHISHVYETGASLYFTVAARETEDPLAQWRAAKVAAGDAILGHGGSITHHHAVGTDHRPWLERQLGPLGVDVLRAVKQRLDPAGVLNPGVLIPPAADED